MHVDTYTHPHNRTLDDCHATCDSQKVKADACFDLCDERFGEADLEATPNEPGEARECKLVCACARVHGCGP